MDPWDVKCFGEKSSGNIESTRNINAMCHAMEWQYLFEIRPVQDVYIEDDFNESESMHWSWYWLDWRYDRVDTKIRLSMKTFRWMPLI